MQESQITGGRLIRHYGSDAVLKRMFLGPVFLPSSLLVNPNDGEAEPQHVLI